MLRSLRGGKSGGEAFKLLPLLCFLAASEIVNFKNGLQSSKTAWWYLAVTAPRSELPWETACEPPAQGEAVARCVCVWSADPAGPGGAAV